VKATARCLTAAVTIFAWLAISNHCAIRALTAKTNATQSSCPFHSKPAKPKTDSTECCKILRATPTTPAKELAPAIIDLFPVSTAPRQLATLEPAQICLELKTLDTGPPGKTSFAELIQNVRAHAPPFVG
jgi:hypothetical protein